MYLAVGDQEKALQIMAENGWIDRSAINSAYMYIYIYIYVCVYSYQLYVCVCVGYKSTDLQYVLCRIVNLAHDVDLSQDTLLRRCAQHFKSSGHVSTILHSVCINYTSLCSSVSLHSMHRLQRCMTNWETTSV